MGKTTKTVGTWVCPLCRRQVRTGEFPHRNDPKTNQSYDFYRNFTAITKGRGVTAHFEFDYLCRGCENRILNNIRATVEEIKDENKCWFPEKQTTEEGEIKQ